MNEPTIELRKVTREDVTRINQWLADQKVSENWFGRYSYGDPAHLGYHPEKVEQFSEQQWEDTFSNPEHIILSICTADGSHIGESHIAIEESLGDGQISILIGEREMWHQGYGTAALKETLKQAFSKYSLFRVWADIPEYNEAALNMFQHLGFQHEGTLRKSRPHEGSRFDSTIMGMLSNEYNSG
ncbi:MAG: GNAT family protein [Chloroflexota bacterium]|nr:GNAT family protein [Chloroflexota bacterium]